MSYFISPGTGIRVDIFGSSKAEQVAREMETPFLGRVPIDPLIAKLCDEGRIEDYRTEVLPNIVRNLKDLLAG